MYYKKEIIERYETLKAMAKEIEVELKGITDQFKASKGGYSDFHVIELNEFLVERVAGKDIFAAKFGGDFLSKNGLLNVTVTQRVEVKKRVDLSQVKVG